MTPDLLASLLYFVFVGLCPCCVHDIEGVPAALVHSKGLHLGPGDCQATLLQDICQGGQAAKPVHRVHMHFKAAREPALDGGLHHCCQLGCFHLIQLCTKPYMLSANLPPRHKHVCI